MQLSDSFTERQEDWVENQFPPLAYFLFLVMLMIMGNLLAGGAFHLWEQIGGNDGGTGPNLKTISGRNEFRWISLLSHLFTFAIPAVLTMWFLARARWASNLRLTVFPEFRNLLFGTIFMLLSFPVAQILYWVNRQISLPEWASRMEKASESTLENLLIMNSPGELLFNIMVVAVIPAIGEELVFRGIVQQRLQRYLPAAWQAIWISALLFSLFHLQFAGFLPRLLLGAVLGYLFFWTQNLWIPIIAHLLINGLQLIVTYLYNGPLEDLTSAKSIISYWPLAILALPALLLTGYKLQRINRRP